MLHGLDIKYIKTHVPTDEIKFIMEDEITSGKLYFEHYFNNVVAVSFIGIGNLRKARTCRKSF